MDRIFSIRELESMIKAIKTDNPYHNKKVKKYACGVFKIDDDKINISHRHIGIQEFKSIR